MRDGEDAVAALAAAGAADEVWAAAQGGGGESGIDDLDEVRHVGRRRGDARSGVPPLVSILNSAICV